MAAPRSDPLADPVGIRRAGRELLSLALIDARNRLLQALARDESPAALRTAARAGAHQERWISCNLQRTRGEDGDPGAPRLAGVEPRIEAWLDPAREAPSADALRAYLEQTLEQTLDLLAGSAEDDRALHVYRQALLHEDRLAQALAERLDEGAPPPRADREALWLPAQRWLLGSPPGGFVPYNERWAHEVAVPEFEIDAQPVNWARYAEFAADGGYDRRELWSEPGWAWAQREGRRAPRRVAQLQGGSVVVERGAPGAAVLQRAPPAQAAMHVNRHEAEAWCRWAGRRLPTEPEWELAAAGGGASRGYVWGDIFEWVAGSARAWPDAGRVGGGCLDAIPPPGSAGVLRGASFATPPRWRHAKARRFAPPERDTMFCGFRSCAL
jgi:formylglycine-generating enzyme required for sulfatase activity